MPDPPEGEGLSPWVVAGVAVVGAAGLASSRRIRAYGKRFVKWLNRIEPSEPKRASEFTSQKALEEYMGEMIKAGWDAKVLAEELYPEGPLEEREAAMRKLRGMEEARKAPYYRENRDPYPEPWDLKDVT